ncbi:hypothetical protein BJ741DRAFT_593036 [Chytriomyces cf. hyalinus JEL632]|nr:hypothetical protein BJ741DRAFT_593036 [Chytriomyces cf. hyalinus JEL632]
MLLRIIGFFGSTIPCCGHMLSITLPSFSLHLCSPSIALWVNALPFTLIPPDIWHKLTQLSLPAPKKTAVHHIFAIAMALGSLHHQNTLSVFCTIPLLLHNIMWASNIHSFTLLTLYNLATFINSSCMYVSIWGLQVQARAVNAPILVGVAIAIVFNNYFLYCHNLKGEFCVRWDPFMWIDGGGGGGVVDTGPQDGGAYGSGAYRGVMLWIVLFWACWMALLHLGASLLKERWARNPPSFAVKADEYLSVSETEEAFMHEGKDETFFHTQCKRPYEREKYGTRKYRKGGLYDLKQKK